MNILYLSVNWKLKGIHLDTSFSFRKPSNTSLPQALSPPPSMDPNYLMRERPPLSRMIINTAASPKQAPIPNPSVSKYMSLPYLKSFSALYRKWKLLTPTFLTHLKVCPYYHLCPFPASCWATSPYTFCAWASEAFF